ncbi:hypothetical protein [Mycobacterium paraterrae]|uniref:Uncharacterized protein n=1 Tax=Mycobacterium paraterrae TaxID=577492 RepID=A0ABY3VKT2_9MYCO|nr:hypothetical protein [Mycobacterium paraterrae]UMB69082.1 hypothetical protein MKK62_22330 [Mycobacterium paraterrae]
MVTDNPAVITPDEAQERLVSPAPVLISEHEVALATAIALQGRPPARRRWIGATHGLLVAVRRSLAAPARDDRGARREYPKHYAFLEGACMAREMQRL